MCLALHGGLGAGKTVFSQGFGEGLGLGVPITSPTYTLINEYDSEPAFFHMDLYRISGEEEAEGLGLEECFDRGVCLVEWAERARGLLPSGTIEVTISVVPGGDERRIVLETTGGLSPDVLAFLDTTES